LSAVLLDDGLEYGVGASALQVSAYEVPGRCAAFRVLRLEREAELTLSSLVHERGDHALVTLGIFRKLFRTRLLCALECSPTVVAFKTIAAYRCGLQRCRPGEKQLSEDTVVFGPVSAGGKLLDWLDVWDCIHWRACFRLLFGVSVASLFGLLSECLYSTVLHIHCACPLSLSLPVCSAVVSSLDVCYSLSLSLPPSNAILSVFQPSATHLESILTVLLQAEHAHPLLTAS
jgi:hypothetical protein